MTAITYSRPPKEIQVLEHPSASGNVPEPMSEILEPRNMQGPPENSILESCGFKGHKWCEDKEGQKNDRGAKGGKLQRKTQTWGRGVSKECMKRGGKKQLSNRKVGKDLKGRWGKWVEGKDKSETDVSGILSVAERELWNEKWMEKRKSWCAFLWKFPVKNSTEEEVKKEKNIITGMRHRHIFLWLPLLFLSLCPKPASSHVSNSNSYFKILISGLLNDY